MRKLLCTFFLLAILWIPQSCLAMEFDIRFGAQQENFVGELWYEDALVWRMALLPGGVVPVMGNNNRFNMVIVPDIEDGFFLFRVQ